MPNVSVTVHDATGNRKQQVDVPDDAPIERLIAVLVERMRFPQNGPDGQLLSYKLQHRTSGRQLLDGQTLADASVKDGDILRLMPEITAGARYQSASSTTRAEDKTPLPSREGGRRSLTRGLGEGARGNDAHLCVAHSEGPHPNPLPKGEGTRTRLD